MLENAQFLAHNSPNCLQLSPDLSLNENGRKWERKRDEKKGSRRRKKRVINGKEWLKTGVSRIVKVHYWQPCTLSSALKMSAPFGLPTYKKLAPRLCEHNYRKRRQSAYFAGNNQLL